MNNIFKILMFIKYFPPEADPLHRRAGAFVGNVFNAFNIINEKFLEKT